MEGWGADMIVRTNWAAESVDDLTNGSNVSV